MGNGDYYLRVSLKQLSPMIHFEHYEDGATLRVTEVKPKLDRFILKWCKDNGVKVERDWYIDKDKSEALNYKMRIQVLGDINEKTLRKTNETDKKLIYDGLIKDDGKPKRAIKGSYFGNMVNFQGKVDREEKIDKIQKSYKESIYYTNEIAINLICFKSGLLKLIEDNIIGFFLLNNFGTRQNKGFGSFKVTQINGKPKIYNAMSIISKYEKNAWYLLGNRQYALNYETALEDIKLIYGFMKGGYNFTKMKVKGQLVISKDYFRGFIYRYFNELNIKNDKAFVKQVVLKDRFNNENRGERKTQGEEYRYVRAMLGLPELLDFRSINEKIHIYNKSIKRYASPILFKIVDDYIFIIPQKVNKNMLNEDFYLTTEKNEESYFENPNEKEKITTPEDFSLVDFLDAFEADFNDKVSKKGGEIGLKEAKNNNLRRANDLFIKKVGEAR